MRLRNLLVDLKSSPQYKNQVTIIDNFLTEFSKLLAKSKMFEVTKEKIVQSVIEKDRIVKVPVQTADD